MLYFGLFPLKSYKDETFNRRTKVHNLGNVTTRIEIKRYRALAIGKDKSVVSRELRRNCDNRSKKYRADLAQRKYENRQKNKSKHIHFYRRSKKYVDECLAKDFSPEQITGRAAIEGRECVSHERIYQYIIYMEG